MTVKVQVEEDVGEATASVVDDSEEQVQVLVDPRIVHPVSDYYQTIDLSADQRVVKVGINPADVFVGPPDTTVTVEQNPGLVRYVAQGPQGPPGKDGTGGPGGGGDLSYVHTQALLATTWIVDHQLGRHPSVHVEDAVGNVLYGSMALLTATVTLVDPVNGLATVEWDGDEVRALMGTAEIWTGVWDLQIVEPGETLPRTLMTGKFTARWDVTRP